MRRTCTVGAIVGKGSAFTEPSSGGRQPSSLRQLPGPRSVPIGSLPRRDAFDSAAPSGWRAQLTLPEQAAGQAGPRRADRAVHADETRGDPLLQLLDLQAVLGPRESRASSRTLAPAEERARPPRQRKGGPSRGRLVWLSFSNPSS